MREEGVEALARERMKDGSSGEVAVPALLSGDTTSSRHWGVDAAVAVEVEELCRVVGPVGVWMVWGCC